MKPFLSFAALAVTALAMQSLPLKAQTANSSSGATSSSSSSSGSTSGSRSTSTSGTSGNSQRSQQRVNSTTNIPITFNSDPAPATDPAGAAGANGSNGSGGNNPPYYGQSDVTVRTTPTVYAPPVSGGNPCTLAVSGGISVIGWGAALGGTWVDEDCANRQKIAMIHNAGYAKAARELMCNDKATYIAFRSTETPCNPRPQFDGPAGPQLVVQPQPVPLAPPPQQMTIIKDRTNLPRCSRTITDNCYAG